MHYDSCTPDRLTVKRAAGIQGEGQEEKPISNFAHYGKNVPRLRATSHQRAWRVTITAIFLQPLTPCCAFIPLFFLSITLIYTGEEEIICEHVRYAHQVRVQKQPREGYAGFSNRTASGISLERVFLGDLGRPSGELVKLS